MPPLATDGDRRGMMRAWVADGAGGCHLQEVAEPQVEAGGVVVAISCVSVNRGEVTRLAHADAGSRPGWDFAGRVVATGTDELSVGTRVAGLALGGAWAERIAISAESVAEIPQNVESAAAAALPIAGVTALRMLRLGSGTIGRRVLVTGASGGVGRFAVQLARIGGAEVTGLIGPDDRGDDLHELGAAHVARTVDDLEGPFDHILESVGGSVLAAVTPMLTLEGTVVIFGNSSNQPTTFSDMRDVYLGGARRLQSFTLYHDMRARVLRPDLATLMGFVGSGVLDPQIDVRIHWTELPRAIDMLESRQVNGKVVLKVGEDA